MIEAPKHYTTGQQIAIPRWHMVEHLGVSEVRSEYGIKAAVVRERRRSVWPTGQG